jgi:uncharacterized LabA/DUF88 family protein
MTRVRVFVDFWNFQLTLDGLERTSRSDLGFRFPIDWQKLGPVLAREACGVASIPDHSFDGVIVYASYNPKTETDRKFYSWATNWLDRQPGVNVECLERRPKSLPRCPICHREISICPHSDCGQAIVATVEKGVDTYIATDLIRLAWEEAYDVAVLVSSDSDLVPAVKFLNQKGRKVIQAGFPPRGVDLATACWASFDVWPVRQDIQRSVTVIPRVPRPRGNG